MLFTQGVWLTCEMTLRGDERYTENSEANAGHASAGVSARAGIQW